MAAKKKARKKPAPRRVAGHQVHEHWKGDALYEVIVRHSNGGVARWHQYIGSQQERRHVADYHLERQGVDSVTIQEVRS